MSRRADPSGSRPPVHILCVAGNANALVKEPRSGVPGADPACQPWERTFRWRGRRP